MSKKAKVVQMKGKRVSLNVLERLTLLNMLPKEGSFNSLKLMRVMREELSFTEAENAALQFRVEGEMMLWNSVALTNKETGKIVKAPNDVLVEMHAKNPDAFEVSVACPDKSFVFGEVIEGIIIKALKDLDKAEKITVDHYSLYEKFMEGNED